MAWYRIVVRGAPSHAGRPDQGTDAIRQAESVLDALDAYDERIRERHHDLLGRAYATVTEFEAGTKENVVPEEAVLTVDRRFLPDESTAEVDQEIDDLLSEVSAEHDVNVGWERIRTYESAEIPEKSHLAETFREHSQAIAGVDPEPHGVSGSTDVRNFINDAGIEAITWGPGDVSRAHTYNEYVELDEVATGHEVLTSALRDLLSE
jgi:succinyl-diaminopimelate desuccinylase